MNIKLTLAYLICLILCAACSEQNIDRDETVAILKGEEINVEDVLTQYPATDQFIENYLREEVVVLEAKDSGITISDDQISHFKQSIYPDRELFYESYPDIENSHQKLANHLEISIEEYFELWALTSIERSQYTGEFIKQKFGEPPSMEESEDWGKEIETYIDQLFMSYIEQGDLIIEER